jgi:membrane protease YdiL (CAAX protease family)
MISFPRPIQIRPANLFVSILLFGFPASLFFISLNMIIPGVIRAGLPWFLIYNLCLVLPLALLLIAAFAGYYIEGRPINRTAIAKRFRLGPLKFKDWLWAIGLAIFMYGGNHSTPFGFVFACLALLFEDGGNWKKNLFLSALILLFLFASYELWRTEPFLSQFVIHLKSDSLVEFMKHFGPSDFMGFPMRGNWWILGYYLIVLLVFNIGGEELWWRGYILPRQELSFGNAAWIVNGVLWACFHIFIHSTLFDLVRMMPTCLALAYVVQRTRNTWTGIIGHTIGNSPLLVQILQGIWQT